MAPYTQGRALSLARLAIERAESGEANALEFAVPPRPLLAQLFDDGALARAVVLLERDGTHGRIAVLPRRSSGLPRIGELLEADHARLDDIADRMCRIAHVEPTRAVVLANMLSFGMRRHMEAEEAVLFPACQARLAGSSQALALMEHDHKAALHYVDRLVQSAERILLPRQRDEAIDGLLRVRRSLGAVLADHNEREERLLFPLLDRTLREHERREILRRLMLF